VPDNQVLRLALAAIALALGWGAGWLSARYTNSLLLATGEPLPERGHGWLLDRWVQIGCALAWALLILHYSPVDEGPWRWLASAVLTLPLVQIAVTDLRRRFVFTHIAYGTTIAGILLSPVLHPASTWWWSMVVSLLGTIGGYGFFALMYWVGKFFLRRRPDPRSDGFAPYTGNSTEPVRFVVNDDRHEIVALLGEVAFNWSESNGQSGLRLQFGNSNAEPQVDQPSDVEGVAETIRYHEAWPGVDVVMHTTSGGIAYNMIVRPGVDPSVIRMTYTTGVHLSTGEYGALHVSISAVDVMGSVMESWQDGPNGREIIPVIYQLLGGGAFGFKIGSYNPSLALNIGPAPVLPPEALSWGDVLIAAMVGAMAGPFALYAVFSGSLLTAIFGVGYLAKARKFRGVTMPFGPGLCLGAYLSFFASMS
jgi:prepilin signal peptidase PulO-like enzyme (type II secretory pathway)